MQTKPTSTNSSDISVDLSWIDMMKGIAIIGVFLDNWTGYMRFATEPAILYSLARLLALGVGPFVQVFFILSGFGLTLGYLKGKANWSWKRWAWRRITKIVVPYVIIVLLSFALGMLGSSLYASIDKQFSLVSLLAYLTFTRNFLPSTWSWNPPLWFMPVIIGLYVSFPVLIKVLEKWGVWVLLLLSALVTFGTIAIADILGVAGDHGADLFTFWMLQFALGMALAHVAKGHHRAPTRPARLNNLVSLGAFLAGAGLFALSWGLRTYVPAARLYNDGLTSVGIFLILLNVCWAARTRVPATGKILCALSSKSYLMYLVHYPIMSFLIGPPLRVPMNPALVIAGGGIYIVAIYLLCSLVARPMEKFTSWLYHGLGS
jgi:peptidoglycan/LPS O-acetylase OafA/YrhL